MSVRRVLRPLRWRFFGALVLVVAVAALDIVDALVLPHSVTGRVLWATLWVLTLPLLWYSWVLARAVVVEPGHRIRFRSVLGMPRSVPVDDSLEVVWFRAVEGTSARSLRTSTRPTARPNGIVDQRWAVLRSKDRTVLRLSGWTWDETLVTELATLAPARAILNDAPTSNRDVLEQYPDYYAWIERRPALEVLAVLVPVAVATIPIFMALGAAFTLITTAAPAP